MVTTRLTEGWRGRYIACARLAFTCRVASQLVQRLRADQRPEIIAAFDRLHFRQQPAHAVSHHHHLVQVPHVAAGDPAVERMSASSLRSRAAENHSGWPVGYR